MTGKHRNEDFNPDWEKEIGKYDAECEFMEKEFIERTLLFGSGGNDLLETEENEILSLYLKGMSLETIAEQNQVELDFVVGMMEIIKAKLSLNDKWKNN